MDKANTFPSAFLTPKDKLAFYQEYKLDQKPTIQSYYILFDLYPNWPQ